MSGSEGALFIAETGRTTNEDARVSWRAGFFYHTDTFSDRRYDHLGRSLADPTSDGLPRARRGDYGGYGVVDAKLWEREHQCVNGFARVGFVPGDRNLIGESTEIGCTLLGFVPGRKNDELAIGIGRLQWSGAARGAVADANRFGAADEPVPDAETVIELTWRFEVANHVKMQPDVQWIHHPGGSSAIPAVLAVGFRMYLNF
jgi:porin